MGENLLKEIEKGSKMAVDEENITHYIYNGGSGA